MNLIFIQKKWRPRFFIEIVLVIARKTKKEDEVKEREKKTQR